MQEIFSYSFDRMKKIILRRQNEKTIIGFIFLFAISLLIPNVTFANSLPPNFDETNNDDSNIIPTVASSSDALIADSSSEALIADLIRYENKNDYIKHAELYCEYQKNIYLSIFQHDEYFSDKLGLSVVNSAELKKIEKLDVDRHEKLIPNSILTDEYSNIELFLVEVEYSVDQVNEYYLNGSQYFLVVTGNENNELKILGKYEPMTDFLHEIKNRTTDSSELLKLNAALNVRLARTYGIIVDGNGDIISYNTDDIENSNQLYAASKRLRTHPIQKCSHKVPTTVRVLMNNGQIKTLDFEQYSKVVLCSEMDVRKQYENALAAQLIALRQYATYYTYYVHQYTGYDLVQNTGDQQYDPDKYSNRLNDDDRLYIDQVYNAFSEWHMDTSSGNAFCSHYAKNSAAALKVGQPCMLQDEVLAWAESGQSFQQILHTGYDRKKEDGVPVGTLKFTVYNGTPLGWKLADSRHSETWYYYDTDNSVARNGFKLISGKYYYLDTYGRMANAGWLNAGGSWYWLRSDGSRLSNDWIEVPQGSGKWYWMGANGIMAANQTLYIKNLYYDFDSSGLCTNPEGRRTK